MTREEREQALEWFRNRPVTMSGAKRMYQLAIEALSQPEIVRCEECKYYNPLFTCRPYCCEKGLMDVFENDFCSRSERRTDEPDR